MAKEKVRTTIGIEKNLYNELDKRGIIRGRKISELVNQLLLEYIQTESLNQLELRSRNFIEDSIDRALKRNFTEQENKLSHIYSSVIYSDLLLNKMNNLTESEYKKLLSDLETENTRFASGMIYKEEFIRQNPFMDMRGILEERGKKNTQGNNMPSTNTDADGSSDDEIDFESLFGNVSEG